jgi:hypothetical protein
MARRIVSIATLTPPAAGTADTTNLVDNTYPFIVQPDSATQFVRIWEVSVVGLASAGAVTPMLFSRDSTVATGTATRGAGQTDAAHSPFSAALALPSITANQFATNKPQRDVANHLANCGLNAFGGQYFWKANRPDECFDIYGQSATTGEVSLFAGQNGSCGQIGAHCVYETL